MRRMIDDVQKANFCNGFLPLKEQIDEQASLAFQEIRENLSRTVQCGELTPGLIIWSEKCQDFLSLYGLFFSKVEHLQLIDFYLAVLNNAERSYSVAAACLETLRALIRRLRLITRDDLTIDWRIFYRWTKRLKKNNPEETYGLSTRPKNFDFTLFLCVHSCSPYFSSTATQEILDLVRPRFCLIDLKSMSEQTKILEYFLPVNLPPHFHDQGFKLWLTEFVEIWLNAPTDAVWELRLFDLFSRVGWWNIGWIDWQPWLEKIFTRLLRGFSLPIGEQQKLTSKYSHISSYVARWIVSTIGNGSESLSYLSDLLRAMKTFFHPSNSGKFQQRLVEFLRNLGEHFVQRLHLERRVDPVWYFSPRSSSRLSSGDIWKFSECLKESLSLIIFMKDPSKEVAEACQYFSIIRPECFVPLIVDKVFTSMSNVSEARRFVSLLRCLPRIARQVVRSTEEYPQGQLQVLPLLVAVLPGLDWNDFEKTSATLDVLETILSLIRCVDCSAAANERTDLTEIEKEVCRSTSMFGEFIEKFFDRIFGLIQILSAESSEALTVSEDPKDCQTLEIKVTSIVRSLVHQCSDDILQIVREKMKKLLTGALFSSPAQPLVLSLIRAMVHHHPVETLKDLLPRTSQSILSKAEEILPLVDDRGDLELIWELNVFCVLLRALGETLLVYRTNIRDVLQRCRTILHKESTRLVALAISNVLQLLVEVYIVDSPWNDSTLSIRTWGEAANVAELHQVRFHLPCVDEIDFALDLIETLLEPELQLFKENLSKDERRRSLKIIESLANGFFYFLPPIDAEPADNSFVPLTAKSNSRYPIYYREIHSHLREQRFGVTLRARLLREIDTVLDRLVSDLSDDIESINTALAIYVSVAGHNVSFGSYVNQMTRDWITMENLRENFVNGKQDRPRCVTIRQIELQFSKFEVQKDRQVTATDKKVLLKLFDFSIHRYSEVRRRAQHKLFSILQCQPLAFEILVDPIAQVLDKPGDEHHDQLKGCLYVLLGDARFFLLTKQSWSMMDKLWPLLVRRNHASKTSIENLIRRIQTKIESSFLTESLNESIDEQTQCAARNLFQPIETSVARQQHEEHQRSNIQFYTHLMESLCSLLKDETCTWGQKKMSMSLLSLLLQRHVPIPSTCIDTCLDFLVHPNIQLRKNAAKSVAAFGHLQKPPRTYAEKSIERRDDRPRPGNRDDNLWLTFNDYRPAETQLQWEETCFLDELYHGYYQWPKTIRYPVNKRDRYSEEQMPADVSIVFQRFRDRNFVKKLIELLVLDEDETKGNRIRWLMFKGLFRNFGLAFVDIFLDQLYLLIRETIPEKQTGSHRAAAEVITGLIRGSKYWTLPMLDELWLKLTPFLTEVCNRISVQSCTHWRFCFLDSLGDQDPRRMFRPIQFLLSLMNNQTMNNTFAETSRWRLVQSLEAFSWRVPALWCSIHDKAKDLLDQSSQLVRQRIALILSVSLVFASTSFDSKSGDNADTNRLIDAIGERLQQAIDVYQSKPLVNLTDQRIELDFEARRALNLIETVIDLHTNCFTVSLHPMNEAIIRLFPSLCEIESIVATDDSLKLRLTTTRLCIGMANMHVSSLEALIQQLEQICSTTSKWHARQVAIEFLQYLIFCNLFNARPYAKRLHALVIKSLFDDQLEVRLVASATLSSFYQCGYLQVTEDDLKHFLVMSETNYFMITDKKKVISTKCLLKRHGGILGFAAVILSSPYDIPMHLPNALVVLCEHSHDPYLIQKSIKYCLSEFRRTHYDSWHEHQTKFTSDQLAALADTLIAHSYFV